MPKKRGHKLLSRASPHPGILYLGKLTYRFFICISRGRLLSQNHQAVSTQHANRQFRESRETELPRNPCNLLDKQIP